ncbi:MAG: hypothetical protein KF689_03930 [Gemmatimonadaceae bacterium]|nr:hypothetical protein [Gemmatimonadaceae bacterium]MCW5825669.1 hypothetical protein [Gemmatimonadaceae bacterium]
MKRFTTVLAAMVAFSAGAGAQVPTDVDARLREVLPADVADRVLARIAEARSRQLPPQAVTALENRALKFASRGVAPAEVERAVGEHAHRMQQARTAIEAGRGRAALGDEIDAGAEAMRQGVDGSAVSALAQSAPSGRSLAVPLYVIGSLVERGLPSDQALQRVQERLTARASDRDLERMAREQARGRPEGVGPGMRPTDRPGATGRPENLPATGGRPATTPRPTPPAGPGRP